MPAREALEPLLETTNFRDPVIPVVANVEAGVVDTASAARDALIRQVDGTVRWVESVELMVDELGVERFIEVGPGKVLGGLIRRIRKGTPIEMLGSADAVTTWTQRRESA